jgi:hypothetical protein
MTRLSVRWFNPIKETLAMTKIVNLWSWFLERIPVGKTNRKIDDPLKEMPLIPTHKPPSNRGFQVVVMNERRGALQYDLSPRKFRIGMIGGLIIAGLSLVGAYSVGRIVWGQFFLETSVYDGRTTNVSSQNSEQDQVSTGLSSSPKGYSNAAGFGTARREAVSDQRDYSDDTASAERSALSMQSTEKLEGDLSSRLHTPQTSAVSSGTASAPSQAKDLDSVAHGQSTVTTQSQDLAVPIVNFNAQDVTVKPTGQANGTLNFRLIRDHPDIAFSGYLFVFVEMQDKKGENRIYVYPDKTRLGEGDLPSNFREGETISFKNNSRVELPYGDIRSGARLARVSILLYNDQGKIVFQRGFEKKELVVAGSSGTHEVEENKAKTTDRRRAL